MLGDPVAPRYTTQRRWLERAGRILGLSCTVEVRLSERIAEELDLMGLDHRSARRCFLTSRSLQQRGAAVASQLSQLALAPGLWLRLLASGCLGGAWAHPWLFLPQVGRRFSPFSQVGRAARGPPSANEFRSVVG